jgi:hypothetical protein
MHHLVDIIEQATGHEPYCVSCDSPTTITVADDTVWLACSSIDEPQSFLRGILDPHTHRPIASLS